VNNRTQAANLKATLEKERAEAAAAAAAAARAAASANGAAPRWAPFQDDLCVRRARLTARVAQALRQVPLIFLVIFSTGLYEAGMCTSGTYKACVIFLPYTENLR